jgi:hypothetical protein
MLAPFKDMDMKICLMSRTSVLAIALVLSACGGNDHLLPVNVAPVSSAGRAQSVFVDTQVTLDGSASTDANSDVLTYAWTLTSKPPGSNVALSSVTAVKPVFTADAVGTYVFTLVVNDGKVDSMPATVTITAALDEVAPVANAGAAQSVLTDAAVRLDGSASADANGDNLTYAWTLTAPSGSSAALTGATNVAPQFTPDVAGDYVASLVVNDGRLSSTTSRVTITAALANAAPVANAGTAQAVTRGATVTFDGSASSDANGDALSYLWSLSSVPAGSAAALSANNIVNPTFAPDLAGIYIAQLIANDGHVDSAPVTVSVTAADTAPVANAGTAQSVARGIAVTLDGSASSDTDNDALTYSWSFVSVPAGSSAALSATNMIHPTFTPDVSGSYVVRLIVNDGQLGSTASTVVITATPATSTTDRIVNGSFEQGFASWSQGSIAVDPGGAGPCGYNVAVAPGVETLTSTVGFPATDGTSIALGSVAATGGSRLSCDLYQDVAIPVGATSITLTYDVALTAINAGCSHTALRVGLYPSTSIPGFLDAASAGSPVLLCVATPGMTLTTKTMTIDSTAIAGTTVRLAFINEAGAAGREVIAIDNVHLMVTATY